MSDLDRWRVFLTGQRVPFTEAGREVENAAGRVITIEQTDGENGDRVSGYTGFLIDIAFRADGSFKEIGAWE